jgi:hypothetical protein
MDIVQNPCKPHEISGFRREANENCALLGYQAACSGNSSPTFRDNLLGQFFKRQESKKKPTFLNSSSLLGFFSDS